MTEKLEKLTIEPEKGAKIEALFNPSQLSLSKSVRWNSKQAVLSAKKNAKQERYDFGSIEPQTLTLHLFFDTYEGAPKDSESDIPREAAEALASLLPKITGLSGARAPAQNVREHTRKILRLAEIDTELHRPPMCSLRWGKVSLLEGVLTSVTEQLLLFLEDGTPVRATMDCTFQELRDDEEGARGELHSADVDKRWVVRPGDTLILIAAKVYGNQALWRRIADANGIENPRLLSPGQALAIPPLR